MLPTELCARRELPRPSGTEFPLAYAVPQELPRQSNDSSTDDPSTVPGPDDPPVPLELTATNISIIVGGAETLEEKCRRLETAYLELVDVNDRLVKYLTKAKCAVRKLRAREQEQAAETEATSAVLRTIAVCALELEQGKILADYTEYSAFINRLAEARLLADAALAEKDKVIDERSRELDDLRNQLVDEIDNVAEAKLRADEAAATADGLREQLEVLALQRDEALQHYAAKQEESEKRTELLVVGLQERDDELAQLSAGREKLETEYTELRAAYNDLEAKFSNVKNNAELLLLYQKEELNETRQELASLREQSSTMEDSMNEHVRMLEKELADLRGEFHSLQEERGSLATQVENLTLDTQKLQTTVQNLTTQNDQLEHLLEERDDELTALNERCIGYEVTLGEKGEELEKARVSLKQVVEEYSQAAERSQERISEQQQRLVSLEHQLEQLQLRTSTHSLCLQTSDAPSTTPSLATSLLAVTERSNTLVPLQASDSVATACQSAVHEMPDRESLERLVASLTLELVALRGHSSAIQPSISLDRDTTALVSSLSLELEGLRTDNSRLRDRISNLELELGHISALTLGTDTTRVQSSRKVKRGICGPIMVMRPAGRLSRSSSRRSSVVLSDTESSSMSVTDDSLTQSMGKSLTRSQLRTKERREIAALEERLSDTTLLLAARENEFRLLDDRCRDAERALEVTRQNYGRLVEEHDKTIENARITQEELTNANARLREELERAKKEVETLKAFVRTPVFADSLTISASMKTPTLPPRQLVSPGAAKLPGPSSLAQVTTASLNSSADDQHIYSLCLSKDQPSTSELDQVPMFPTATQPVEGGLACRVMRQPNEYEEIELSDVEDYELVNIYSHLTDIEEELLGLLTSASLLTETSNTEAEIDGSLEAGSIPLTPSARSGPSEAEAARVLADLKALRKRISNYAVFRERRGRMRDESKGK